MALFPRCRRQRRRGHLRAPASQGPRAGKGPRGARLAPRVSRDGGGAVRLPTFQPQTDGAAHPVDPQSPDRRFPVRRQVCPRRGTTARFSATSRKRGCSSTPNSSSPSRRPAWNSWKSRSIGWSGPGARSRPFDTRCRCSGACRRCGGGWGEWSSGLRLLGVRIALTAKRSLFLRRRGAPERVQQSLPEGRTPP